MTACYNSYKQTEHSVEDFAWQKMVHALKLIYKDEVLRMLDPGRNDFYLKQAKFIKC